MTGIERGKISFLSGGHIRSCTFTEGFTILLNFFETRVAHTQKIVDRVHNMTFNLVAPVHLASPVSDHHRYRTFVLPHSLE